jgi:hypothetical protein
MLSHQVVRNRENRKKVTADVEVAAHVGFAEPHLAIGTE